MEIIDEIMNEESNYKTLQESLQERFENEKKTIRAMVEVMTTNLKKDLESIRQNVKVSNKEFSEKEYICNKLCDQTEDITRCLIGLGDGFVDKVAFTSEQLNLLDTIYKNDISVDFFDTDSDYLYSPEDFINKVCVALDYTPSFDYNFTASFEERD